jgi:hypothetical protein
MNIRNHTSTVPVERSISAIEKLLVEAGATHISKFYEGAKLDGILFQLPVNGIPLTFKLPSKPESVAKVMAEGVKRPRRGTLVRIDEQAQRTAWKLLHDWVHVQVSMVIMEQAEAIQVFLPYTYNPKNGQTFFERLKDGGFKQLSMGKEGT